MNRQELERALNDLKVSPDEYSLEGSLSRWDVVVLSRTYAGWSVIYMDERGNQERLASFATEDEACIYIYAEFKRLKKR